jgi:hypothetical protein
MTLTPFATRLAEANGSLHVPNFIILGLLILDFLTSLGGVNILLHRQQIVSTGSAYRRRVILPWSSSTKLRKMERFFLEAAELLKNAGLHRLVFVRLARHVGIDVLTARVTVMLPEFSQQFAIVDSLKLQLSSGSLSLAFPCHIAIKLVPELVLLHFEAETPKRGWLHRIELLFF